MGLTGKKILIIEDDKFLAHILKNYFDDRSFVVETVNDGENGLKKAASFGPDLIMLDILMPGMSGIAVLAELRKAEKTKATPVIIVSNVDDQILSNRATELGASVYFIKANTSLDVLEGWVNDLLGRS